jgi:hypothetical protein
MAYSNFKLAQVLQKFELVTDSTVDLFPRIDLITPSDLLKNTLEQNVPLARQIATEKARSEFIIAPILSEVWQRNKPNVGFFSGVEFTVDESQGLKGTCDFLFTRAKEQSIIVAPVLAVVEAKKEDLKPGMGHCIAEMVAARIFNARDESKVNTKTNVPIYGVVTTGTNWQFLKLDGQTVYIDREERYLNGASKLLGILFQIVSGNG